MARSFDHVSNLDVLRDFDAFVFGFGQISQCAELDQLVEQFIENKIVIEKYRRPEFGKLVAIREFRKAVITSALTARGVYLAEKDRSCGIAACKKNIKALRKVRAGISQLVPVAIVPGHEDNVLKYRRAIEAIDIEATKKALEKGIAAAAALSRLQARNFKNTDIFKHMFVQNLGVCWKKLTSKKPPISDDGPFVEFVRASVSAIGITDNSDVGRYAKGVFTRKKIS
jgi:hypothetical protein